MMTLFRSPRTAVHLVTVLEEMPVQETADGIAELRRRGLPVGGGRGQPGPPPRPARRPRRRPRGPPGRGPDRRRPGRGRASRSTTGWSTACSPRRATTPSAAPSRTPSASWSPALGVPTYELPRLAGGVDLGGLYELAADARGRAGAGMNGRARQTRVGPLATSPGPAPAARRRRAARRPRHRHHRLLRLGGVGKTTTSAALALRAAERGRKVVVLTIDPARRLAQSMGIEALDNTPRPVAGPAHQRPGHRKGGSLDAMMLDMKRTFDEVVESQATPEKAQADPGEPLLHRAVELVRRHPGVHGDGEARPAPRATPRPTAPTT